MFLRNAEAFVHYIFFERYCLATLLLRGCYQFPAVLEVTAAHLPSKKAFDWSEPLEEVIRPV
jgi:hypothetical protein